MNVVLQTLANWNISLNANFEKDTQGDAFRIIQGNKREYVKGLKTVLVVANINEILLGGKNEEIVGLETKLVMPRLSETFVGMKNSGTVAVTLESNSADKNKFAPTTSQRQQGNSTAVCPDVEDLMGKVEEKYSSLIVRGTNLTEKIQSLYLKATSIKQQASQLKETVDAFNGNYGSVVWKADAWTEACKGAYTVNAGTYDVKSKGAVEIKGSEVKVTWWKSPGVVCAGGKVKIGKNLEIS